MNPVGLDVLSQDLHPDFASVSNFLLQFLPTILIGGGATFAILLRCESVVKCLPFLRGANLHIDHVFVVIMVSSPSPWKPKCV